MGLHADTPAPNFDFIGIIEQLFEEIEFYKELLNNTDEALYWLLNLLHGQSKGGIEYNPPNSQEWEEAIEEGKKAHEQVKENRLKIE